jgi:hypothetical protein
MHSRAMMRHGFEKNIILDGATRGSARVISIEEEAHQPRELRAMRFETFHQLVQHA